ncbi:DUF6344 domain-containing protein [Streptomyces justiciae]|uniref:DUF6344 domain-containing protein n=1 Tax=Streptomyces justiciae TaxID=2780140 RepID=A0ABU3LV95_9ACTN|nr:DUF6344 domain-containing protein [Streptomyces justiciae]MBE8471488.1 hypothetical protein [Streptomyces justiciae]MCW8381983.1 DUF6344 domain-containing protein [Streptomyces justiciae]MDT7842674.1 DUF6344 domain-containing protein [Streptomyces justiciae]
MDRNKVMKLWTAIVTAFLALCTTLGLVTTTAAAAVPQADTTRNSTAPATAPELTPWAAAWSWSLTHARSLPPTMKQRIRAEAHGKTPSCRHRSPSDTESTDEATALCDDTAAAPQAEPAAPHGR